MPPRNVSPASKQHRTAIGLPGCAQVVEKPGQKRQSTAPVPGEDEPVQIGVPTMDSVTRRGTGASD